MNEPTSLPSVAVGTDTVMLGAYLPVPGFGVLPVNAFVIRSREPVLVDTGVAALGADFMRALGEALDPSDLRWIWLTHVDADHTGSLARVLEAAPHARLVTSYVGMAKLALQGFALDRVYLINPGQSLDVGDRTLEAVKPPTFDAPETTAVLDPRTRTLFSSDCGGALLDAPAESAAAVGRRALRDGMTLWATVDAPWLAMTDGRAFAEALARIEALSAETWLSSHLPPARGMTPWLLAQLDAARAAPPFVGPDQQAFEASLAAA